MSSDNEFSEIGDEPLDEHWFEREQEELQLVVESDEPRVPPESESYETIAEEQIDYANDEKQIKLAIERLKNLRLELQDLRHRKTRVFNILTEHIEKGLVSFYQVWVCRVTVIVHFIKKTQHVYNLFIKNCFMRLREYKRTHFTPRKKRN